ncbi:3-hydroxyacyl-CoA dehydrogenase [Streptomyces sp. 8K308]|uniref:enoyl-CoA hydratase-related protein n=1 Tax=Streptomyces sp. 8K308 TaxID=2530388 RepID=UPI00104D1FFC|nr:enoyl-CoA hydratase-related protein [Streptomyces sp. 8K308]TDC26657.1 3-hydroxyacyl-CoA dehydrogenase [Streptomyces sp. 8K308]
MASATTPDLIRWERDAEGVVTLVLDAPGRSANTVDAAFTAALDRAVDRLERERDHTTGVILTSAKKTFLGGADLRELIAVTRERAAEFLAGNLVAKRTLRRLETLGRPVVAALGGSALGGGYELALACHHRIALDVPGSEIGLPEVTLGLLPGGGGVTRAVRLLGLAGALPTVLLEGRRHTPREALTAGLVDELATDPEELLAKARAFVRANPDARQPWDTEGHRIPGGAPGDRALAPRLIAFPAQLEKRLRGAPFPAPRLLLAAAVEGAQVDLETALLVEGRYLTELVTGQTSKNMIQGLFLDPRAVAARQSAAARPARPARRVAVVGAGEPAAAIVRACAAAGLDMAAADAPEELADHDVVIATLPDEPDPDHKAFQRVADALWPDALLCATGPTVPVARLAERVRRPADLLGLRFPDPADQARLVEIVRGPATGDAALARALDLARWLGVTPIVVHGGSFVSRVLVRYLAEGAAMVGEGVAPASVEQAAAQAGYETGPLALLDEVSLPLVRRVRDGAAPHPGDAVVDRMLDAFDRPGRAAGAGFHDYDAEGRRTRLWPGLREHFASAGAAPADPAELGERLLFAAAIEAVRCLADGVVASVAEANVGSLLGAGFPGWTGGALQFANGYPGGLPALVTRADRLSATHGERFAPPPLLAAKAGRGEIFSDG